ncbi:FAD-binding oxidoreductase [Lipingzhangella sp. LS1_29]|uniref:FAD-binding oxidoreductase n=1 Tax=Lipingzhangella rawalii TaxID=2055835 RepID=A0ABU2HAX7_9ACTN|nr:FAD-binding oxidoreductase [Lipingzhangella rawalii]MDS1271995.1 FAD-binding oxidoreductase [Lipingzhangella rawalii]
MRVIVVGGGIVGASAAFHLARRGVDVTLVDATRPGQATAAGAGVVFPWPFPWDAPPARAFALRAAAHLPGLVAELTDDGVDPGYSVVGGISVSTDTAALDRDYGLMTELSRRRGYERLGAVRRLEPGEPAARFPLLPDSYAGVEVAGTARVDGRMARAALVSMAKDYGLTLVSGFAELTGTAGDNARVRGVRVAGDELEADVVVVAAGVWTAPLLEPFGVAVPVRSVRGQIVHTALPGYYTRDWPVLRFPAEECHIVAFPPDRLVLGSTWEPGSDLEHRVTVRGLHEGLSAGIRMLPGLADATVVETRVGFRPSSADGLQILGPLAELPGVVVATGLGSMGLTLGPYQGVVAATLALGEEPDVNVSAFRPDRPVAD